VQELGEFLLEELVGSECHGAHVPVDLQCDEAVQVPADAQRECDGGRRQLGERRADVVEEPRVEVGPVELAALVQVCGVRPGGRGQRGEPGADPAYGVGGGAAVGDVIAGNGVAEDEPETLLVAQ